LDFRDLRGEIRKRVKRRWNVNPMHYYYKDFDELVNDAFYTYVEKRYFRKYRLANSFKNGEDEETKRTISSVT
jgi:DNA-binding transcriptional regulator YbjK